jgi:glycerol kinase
MTEGKNNYTKNHDVHDISHQYRVTIMNNAFSRSLRVIGRVFIGPRHFVLRRRVTHRSVWSARAAPLRLAPVRAIMPPSLVGALDQGTTSTRFILYRIDSRSGAKLTAVSSHQMEHRQIFPQPGWCEHDCEEIVANALECMARALSNVPGGATKEDVACVGITNQRETVVAWDCATGDSLCNAIVWLDTRTSQICADLERELGGKDSLRAKCGLPISTYFSGTKMKWLLENDEKVREAARSGRLRMGTVDAWLTFKLTGGDKFVTDCTNASRTLLMDLATLRWDEDSVRAIFRAASTVEDDAAERVAAVTRALPEIVSCAEPEAFGVIAVGALTGIRITASMGDQHAATLGQRCVPGEAKNTYGTGCFCLRNTGGDDGPVHSKRGLVSTVCWKLGRAAKTSYALEGSVAVAGAGVQWLRDNLGIITRASEIERKASEVPDAGGVVFVPAFSGLFAPRWRSDARGVIVGLTQHSNSAHVCRALLEAICFQTKDVLDAMESDARDHARECSDDSGAPARASLARLRVDGGASANSLLMQIQADIAGIPVSRPANVETTAMGAALASGVGAGLWREADIFSAIEADEGASMFYPTADANARDERYRKWSDAVERSFGLA